MTDFTFTSPEGKDYTVSGPDGATKEQAFAILQQQLSSKPSITPSPPIPQKNTGIGANLIGSVLDPALAIGTGMVAKPVSEIAGLAATAKDYLSGNIEGNPQGFQQYVQNALTYQPRTEAGKLTTEYNPLSLVGKGIGWGANKVANVVGQGAAADTTRGMLANATREAIPQALSIYGASKAQEAAGQTNANIANKQSALDIAKSQNAATDAVIQEGKSVGYKFTPDELNKFGAGHPLGSAAEDVSALHVYHLNREANAMDANASLANYGKTLDLVRQDLKMPNGNPLPQGTAIGETTLNKFIEQHGKVYEAVEKQPGVIEYSKFPQYTQAINNLESNMSEAKAQYPDLTKNTGLDTLQSSLTAGESTTPAAAMQIIKKLRRDANNVLSSNDPKPEALALASLQKTAANSVENLLGDFLQSEGKTKLFDAFQNSRIQIAKGYAVKNALDGTVLNTGKLARNGEGLTGNLKIIQDMRLQHPNLMLDPRTISTSGKGMASNALVGAGIATFGHPVLGAAVAARPFAGKAMMSDLYQNNFATLPSYQVGGLQTAMSKTLPYAIGGASAATPSLSDLYNRQGGVK